MEIPVRAIDEKGNTIDFYFSVEGMQKLQKCYLKKLIKNPTCDVSVINTDKNLPAISLNLNPSNCMNNEALGQEQPILNKNIRLRSMDLNFILQHTVGNLYWKDKALRI